ncbi:hypothetical protein WG66_004448 [Moniliophthora roreri]|nr:hypothetical protein WG66_004448 [Moniliophthora roreri]
MSISAQTLKEEADIFFRQQKYDSARRKYQKAIKLDSKNPVLYANCSLCYLKVEPARELFNVVTLKHCARFTPWML